MKILVTNIPSHSFERVSSDIARVLGEVHAVYRWVTNDVMPSGDIHIHVSSFIWWQQPTTHGLFRRVIWYTALEYIPFPFPIDDRTEVVTVSRTCARWIKMGTKMDARVVYHGIDTDPPTNHLLAMHLRRRYGDFVLYVGTNIERKGLVQLIDAVRILNSDGARVNLVMVLHTPKGSEAEFWKPYSIPEEPYIHVHEVDRLSDEDIHAFYEACSVYVQPSLVEGFGLPPLEASAHRRPVVLGAYDVARELFRGYRRICPVARTEFRVFGYGVFVYRYTDPKKMAELIWDALNNPDDNLHDYVVRNFSLRNYLSLIE